MFDTYSVILVEAQLESLPVNSGMGGDFKTLDGFAALTTAVDI